MHNTFETLGLPDRLVSTLARSGFQTPFPIQAMSIPDSLAGRDIQGRAPTGSGKTLAFGLPALSLVSRADSRRPCGLILAPTRELAEQIRKDLTPLASAVDRRIAAIFGGVSYGPQKKDLNRGVDILVATPGRLEDLLAQGCLELSKVEIAVIDEADRMADMGFLPAVRRILALTSPQRQTLLFSATLDGDVAVLARESQRNPVRVESEPTSQQVLDVDHRFLRVERSDRLALTADLIRDSQRTLVFTRTRRGADRLAKQLEKSDVSAVAMHGGRSQSQRTRALRTFAKGRASALIATDVAARGIHVDSIDVVLHYDLAGDPKDYIHRSGRTARAGAGGTVITFVLDGQEKDAKSIQRAIEIDSPLEKAKRSDSRSMPRRDPARDSASQLETRPKKRHVAKAAKDGSLSIFVGNLPWRVDDANLKSMFSGHGQVRRASIVTHGRTGRSKGFGFVEMGADEARSAISALDGSLLEGRSLRVRVAR